MKKVLIITALIVMVSFLAMTCTKDKSPTLPILSTSTITDITETTAIGGGFVSSDGSAAITARGICWGSTADPTISNSKSSDGEGVGQYVSSISGLTAGTIYHVRAYATNSVGTAYGADIIFSTSGDTPSCITIPATEIYLNSATLNGAINPHSLSTTVTFEYGNTTSYGQVVTASQNPIMGNELVNVSIGINGLSLGTNYHFRVKTENSFGTCYGGDMVFTTLSSQSIPTSGLIAYYPFNGNANDESGNNHNGTIVSAIESVDRFGKANRAYGFDGNNGTERYIYSNIGMYHTISFCAWFKSPYPTTLYPTILVYGSNNSVDILLNGNHPNYIADGTVGHIWAGSSINNQPIWSTYVVSDSYSADNNWHFMVVTFVPNDKLYLYIDNQLIKTAAYTENYTTDDLLYIGNAILEHAPSQTHESHFNGSIDDIRIYNRKLSDIEIQELYHEGGW